MGSGKVLVPSHGVMERSVVGPLYRSSAVNRSIKWSASWRSKEGGFKLGRKIPQRG